MRNYQILYGQKTHIHGDDGHGSILNGDIYNFGYDELSLSANINVSEAAQRAALPAYTWTFSTVFGPQKIYFLMNKENISKLFNLNAAGIFAQCSINDTPTTTDLDEIVQFDAQGSPRATFPTDLGTDGQRLRQGQTASSGFALNYLAKLYFLTSNPQFKALFDALKQKKITDKQALAAAAILVKTH